MKPRPTKSSLHTRSSVPQRTFCSKSNLLETTLTKRLNIEFPFIQAPMAGSTSPSLAAAVSNCGGLGSLACAYMEPLQLTTYLKETFQLTNKPLSVNLFASKNAQMESQNQTSIAAINKLLNHIREEIGIPKKQVSEYNWKFPVFEEQCQAILESFRDFNNSKMFTFTFGIPDSNILSQFKKEGWVIAGTATTLPEALALHESGVDFVVAQGSEAGGHRGTFLPVNNISEALIPTATLSRQIVNEFCRIGTTTGVIAAGGITDGKSIHSYLKAGCAAVQVGTLFLTSQESGAPEYVRNLVGTEFNTVVTSAVTGKHGRAIANTLVSRLESAINSGEVPQSLPFPIQHLMTTDIRSAAGNKGHSEYMFILWGQHGDKCKKISAASLVRQLMEECKAQ